MPKETISSTPNSNHVTVGWGRDQGTVQIHTASPERLVAATVERAERGSDLPEHGAKPTAEGVPFSGWFADLGRADLNDLIRVLRRARDQAFGRDE